MEMAAYDLITVGFQKRNMEFWTHNAMNMLGGIATMHYVLVGVCSADARWIKKWIRMALGLVCFSRRNTRTSPASPAAFRSLRRRDGDPSVWRAWRVPLLRGRRFRRRGSNQAVREAKWSVAEGRKEGRKEEGSDRQQQMDAEELVRLVGVG